MRVLPQVVPSLFTPPNAIAVRRQPRRTPLGRRLEWQIVTGTYSHPRTRPRGSSQGTVLFLLLAALIAGGGYWLYSTGRLAGLMPSPAPAGPTVQPPSAGKGGGRPTPPRMNPGKGGAAGADEPDDLAGTIFDMGDGTAAPPNGARPKPAPAGGDGAAAAARRERVATAQAAVKAAR